MNLGKLTPIHVSLILSYFTPKAYCSRNLRFFRSVNPISTIGADYVHLITPCPLQIFRPV